MNIWLGYIATDQEAKYALNDPISNCSVPYSDFKFRILKYIHSLWQTRWNEQENNTLREVQPLIGKKYM